MGERELHYFARGNTAAGLHSLMDSVLQGIRTIYVLQGYPGGTAALLGRLASEAGRCGWKAQLIHQPLDSDLLEGIILEELAIGFVDSAAWPSEDREHEGSELRFVDLCGALDYEQLGAAQERIISLEQEIANLYTEAYATFLHTLRIHDEWEKFYIDNLNRENMDQLALDLADTYFVRSSTDKQAQSTHRFLGAATWRGAVDFVPNLTDRLQTRVFVKGRPGSGKSTLFRKLASLAAERGIDTEIYHCGFDPGSLDMLIFPELDLGIFDSIAPHEHFPVRDGDSILDVYDLAITPGTDEKYADSIQIIKGRYSASMKQAIALLAEIKTLTDQLENIYGNAADQHALSEIESALISGIDGVNTAKETVSP